MGTSALTGNDSGCSGRLPAVQAYQFPNERKERVVLGQFPDQPDSIIVSLPETQYSARAHVDARVADRSDGIQSFVVRTGGDNLGASGRDHPSNWPPASPYFGIMLPRGIEIVVISGETAGGYRSATFVARQVACRLRFLQTPGLLRGQHSKRGTHLHAHPPDLPDHGQDTLEPALPSREISPSSAHTKPGAPVFLRLTSRLEDGFYVYKRRRLGRGRVPRGLRTV